MNRIHSLESLRGLLAFWVVVGHTIKHSGYMESDLGFLKVFAQPGLAVDVFIILSGFVIFFLLDQKPTAYLQFIVRRWFRLAPVFLSVLIVSALTIGWQTNVISAFPFKNATVEADLAIHLDTIKYFPGQLLAHILMLHGAIANFVMPNSQYAFIGQAWSISVEWQFYLVAPLICALILKKQWYRLGGVILSICLLRALNYGGEGFAINQAAYFLVGILSYFAWKYSAHVNVAPEMMNMFAIVAAALIFLLLTKTISLLIWIAILNCVIAERRQTFNSSQKWLLSALHSPLLQWLGKISYSMYMVHMLVLYSMTHLVMSINPNISKLMFLFVMLPTVAITTIAISVLSFRFLEQPGILAGTRVDLFMKAQHISRIKRGVVE